MFMRYVHRQYEAEQGFEGSNLALKLSDFTEIEIGVCCDVQRPLRDSPRHVMTGQGEFAQMIQG